LALVVQEPLAAARLAVSQALELSLLVTVALAEATNRAKAVVEQVTLCCMALAVALAVLLVTTWLELAAQPH
jgi:hypothetical protein